MINTTETHIKVHNACPIPRTPYYVVYVRGNVLQCESLRYIKLEDALTRWNKLTFAGVNANVKEIK